MTTSTKVTAIAVFVGSALLLTGCGTSATEREEIDFNLWCLSVNGHFQSSSDTLQDARCIVGWDDYKTKETN